MSVSIGWRPLVPNRLKYVNGGNSFMTAFENAFGSLPVTLNVNDIRTLEGIKACGYDGASDLISALSEHESIIVEADY